MLTKYKARTNIGIGVGFLVMCIGTWMTRGHGGGISIAGRALVVAGLLFYLWGCAMYAKAKGQHPAWGLLGLGLLLGLIALVILPDEHATPQRQPSAGLGGPDEAPPGASSSAPRGG